MMLTHMYAWTFHDKARFCATTVSCFVLVRVNKGEVVAVVVVVVDIKSRGGNTGSSSSNNKVVIKYYSAKVAK